MEESEAERIIEAALFMSSKPLAVAELGKLIGVAAPGFVTQRIDSLKGKYDASKSAVEIANEGGRYYMRVRAELVPHVKDFASEAEISKHALKTLAYISKNEGVMKRDLFKVLGGTIYSDVSELREKGFVTQKRAGRSSKLNTTPKFKTYFGQG